MTPITFYAIAGRGPTQLLRVSRMPAVNGRSQPQTETRETVAEFKTWKAAEAEMAKRNAELFPEARHASA